MPDLERNGDGRAITLHQAGLDLPEVAGLGGWLAEASGESARARGVSADSERGWQFRGRTAALRRMVSWLGRDRADRRALVISGSPGTGKSAVLTSHF